MSEKRLFLTGASGLLGRAIFKKFSEVGWEVLGVSFSRTSPQLLKLDLRDVTVVQKTIADFAPSFIIHSAAMRFPDQVDSNPEAAFHMNVKVTEQLATIADKLGVPMLYVSTDYVFDGRKPPYKVEDDANPINTYGKTKLEGEREVLAVNKGNLILRVPVLYGPVEKLSESAVTTLVEPLLNSQKTCKMSNYERRYPVHVDDIAEICLSLAEKRMKDPVVSGVFQWSGKEMLTKYQMVCRIADIFSLPHSHVQPVDNASSGGASRPYDTQMDSSSLVEALGMTPNHTPFDVGIRECLQHWISK